MMKKSKSLSYKKCCVKYCRNKVSVKTASDCKSYFTFPKDITRRAMWIENCMSRLSDENIFIKDVRICQDHFENKMFLNVNRKNRLTDNAVPTLFNDDILTKQTRDNETENHLDLSFYCETIINEGVNG